MNFACLRNLFLIASILFVTAACNSEGGGSSSPTESKNLSDSQKLFNQAVVAGGEGLNIFISSDQFGASNTEDSDATIDYLFAQSLVLAKSPSHGRQSAQFTDPQFIVGNANDVDIEDSYSYYINSEGNIAKSKSYKNKKLDFEWSFEFEGEEVVVFLTGVEGDVYSKSIVTIKRHSLSGKNIAEELSEDLFSFEEKSVAKQFKPNNVFSKTAAYYVFSNESAVDHYALIDVSLDDTNDIALSPAYQSGSKAIATEISQVFPFTGDYDDYEMSDGKTTTIRGHDAWMANNKVSGDDDGYEFLVKIDGKVYLGYYEKEGAKSKAEYFNNQVISDLKSALK